MPFTVKSHCVSAHSLRGAGSASRLSFSNDELCQRGWKIEKYGKGFKWITNEGQTFYSSREVQSYLEKEVMQLSDDSDADYRPSASSDDCFSSPEKLHFPSTSYSASKR